MPAHWQGELVLHSHGGPFLGAPTMKRVEEDLQRWSIMPRAGYAWAGSSFRQVLGRQRGGGGGRDVRRRQAL
jgi:hypothetical protein